MPKRTDIKKILLIGAGPIVIGQACEFDYSGTQACKSLKEEGYEVILLNSNPATIMTDPEFADRTYIEPITTEVVRQIIVRDKPDALLPTMGGQTALNVALNLAEQGILDKHNVELIGANVATIKKISALCMRAVGSQDDVILARTRSTLCRQRNPTWRFCCGASAYVMIDLKQP